MIKTTRGLQHLAIVLILVMTMTSASVLKINNTTTASTNQHPLFQFYQVVNPLEVYQTEKFNLSISITNIYFEDVLNASFQYQIPEEIEYLSSTLPELEYNNETETLNNKFGIISVNQNIQFSITYNVTSSDTKAITLPGINVTCLLQNGIKATRISNEVNIFLKGEPDITEEEILKPIPSATISAHPMFSVLGILFPLLAYGISIVVMRRLRKYPQS